MTVAAEIKDHVDVGLQLGVRLCVTNRGAKLSGHAAILVHIDANQRIRVPVEHEGGVVGRIGIERVGLCVDLERSNADALMGHVEQLARRGIADFDVKIVQIRIDAAVPQMWIRDIGSLSDRDRMFVARTLH